MSFAKLVDSFVLIQMGNSESFLKTIHPDDPVYQERLKQFNGRHHRALFSYLAVGNLMSQIVHRVIFSQIVGKVIDNFGQKSISCLHLNSGYGYLTRFLTHILPPQNIWVADSLYSGVEFQVQNLGVNGIQFESNLDGKEFDLILVGDGKKVEKNKIEQVVLPLLAKLTEKGCLVFPSLDSARDGHEQDRLDDLLEEEIFKSYQYYRVAKGFGAGQDLHIFSKGGLKDWQLTEVPHGQTTAFTMTENGEFFVTGWVTDKVDQVEIFIQDRLITSIIPSEPFRKNQNFGDDPQKKCWSSIFKTLENYSRSDTLLIRIKNQDNLYRIIELCPLNSVFFLHPTPPGHLIHAISGSSNVDAFITSLPNLRYLVRKYLRMAGLDFNQFETILDFGCGVGRFLFAFESELTENQQLFGCDVSPECAQWCQNNIDFATVKPNNILPPLPFATSQFNLVYAASVFTHLRLDLQYLWTWEVYRVLQPGGILMMTLHGPQFFPQIYQLSHQAQVADSCQLKTESQLYSYGDQGLFFYLDVGGDLKDQGQNEVAAVHHPAFVDDQFWMFERRLWVSQSLLAGGQDLYILQKPLGSTVVARPLPCQSNPEETEYGKMSVLSKAKDADRYWVELAFQLEGQGRFRADLQVEPAGFYTLECDVRVVQTDTRHLLGQRRLPFNQNRVFGNTHYEVVTLEIPPTTGLVTVSLMVVITDRGTLAPDQTVNISWNFAHFI